MNANVHAVVPARKQRTKKKKIGIRTANVARGATGRPMTTVLLNPAGSINDEEAQMPTGRGMPRRLGAAPLPLLVGLLTLGVVGAIVAFIGVQSKADYEALAFEASQGNFDAFTMLALLFLQAATNRWTFVRPVVAGWAATFLFWGVKKKEEEAD